MRDVRLPDFPLALPVEVRFRDLDAMGHVNNAVYFSYLEQARTRYWLTLLPGSIPPEGITDMRRLGFILVHAECDFASPAHLSETLLVGCRISEMGRTSFACDYRIVSGAASTDVGARLVATARTVQVLYDWAERRPIPISDELRRLVQERQGGPVRHRPG